MLLISFKKDYNLQGLFYFIAIRTCQRWHRFELGWWCCIFLCVTYTLVFISLINKDIKRKITKTKTMITKQPCTKDNRKKVTFFVIVFTLYMLRLMRKGSSIIHWIYNFNERARTCITYDRSQVQTAPR